VAYLKVLPCHLPEGLRKTMKDLRIVYTTQVRSDDVCDM
jgi:hypothetical protein